MGVHGVHGESTTHTHTTQQSALCWRTVHGTPSCTAPRADAYEPRTAHTETHRARRTRRSTRFAAHAGTPHTHHTRRRWWPHSEEQGHQWIFLGASLSSSSWSCHRRRLCCRQYCCRVTPVAVVVLPSAPSVSSSALWSLRSWAVSRQSGRLCGRAGSVVRVSVVDLPGTSFALPTRDFRAVFSP